MNHLPASLPPQGAGESRDTIQVMGSGFDARQLMTLVEWLEEDGHRCRVFEDLSEMAGALSDVRSKLMLVGACGVEFDSLLKAIRDSNSSRLRTVPILLYLNGCPQEAGKDWLSPEIDDFLLASSNPNDLRLRVDRLVRRWTEQADELEQIRRKLISYLGIRQFIGSAPVFIETLKKIPRVAACDATVLLTGDTGTGKEMCARAIHYLSSRSEKPLIPINCGSIPADLFENELFGHETGAYTDARRARRGLVAEAEGGTLFLDEVDALSLTSQIKLLRFLQDRQYRPLGASYYRRADVRILAASNQDLAQKVQEGAVREDLYYRLKVVSLSLPPLRDRQQDIIPLAMHFLETSAAEYGRSVRRFSPEATQKLLSYVWPGNVRELENMVRQAVVLADGPVIREHELHLASDVPAPGLPAFEPLKVAKSRVIETFERNYLRNILSACNGNISQAAREAKKNRRVFFSLLKKYGLTSDPVGWRPDDNGLPRRAAPPPSA